MNIRVIEGLLKEYQIQVTYAASGQAWIVLYAGRLAVMDIMQKRSADGWKRC